MDVLAGLLEGPRARGAFMIRALFDPPWSVRIADEAPLSVMVMVRGTAWIVPADGAPAQRIGPGDLAIARGPDHYTCADEATTAPFAEIRPGEHCVLDGAPVARYRDLGLRAWFSRPEAAAPAWYLALGDPVVGCALRLLQDDPAHPWTIADLAAKAGVSRAAFARRFTDLVGEPPMTYLTNWRLALAADLLRDSGPTIGAIARRVGYGSAFALSGAFKRVYGISPQEYRGV